MKVDLPVHSFALASSVSVPVQDGRLGDLPAPGFRSRKARLCSLAWDLCQSALGRATVGEDASVFFGTALGCLTETAAFVENMIQGQGVAPKPRAFTSSVHNALASEVARKLGARGECQTFVGGENSHVQALFAAACARGRGLRGDQFVGALDEWTDYVERGRRACEGIPLQAEGGAVFHLRGDDTEAASLARISALDLARPVDGRAWMGARLDDTQVDGVLASAACLPIVGEKGVDTTELVGDFPSSGAVAVGLATALLAGEADWERIGLAAAPRRLAVASATRFGEFGLVILESEG